MALYKILSIDGGGIRGVIPAVLLTEMEKRTSKAVYSIFDLIAGTSTGGILAAGLVAPASPDHESTSPSPRFKASDLLALYEEHGKDIFRRSFCDRITSLWGWADEKYPNDGIETVLENYFGNAELKDAFTEILVTSYEIEERQPYFFKSRKAQENPQERNHFLRDVARATSAAPTYFEPAEIRTVGELATRNALSGRWRCLRQRPGSLRLRRSDKTWRIAGQRACREPRNRGGDQTHRLRQGQKLGQRQLGETSHKRDDGRRGRFR